MSDCNFCSGPNVRIIIRTKLVQAFPTNIPIVPGHVLVCPVRHVETFEELTTEEKKALFALIEKLKTALKESFGAEGFNHAWNEGRAAGQAMPHFHFHIVPRKHGDHGVTEYEPRKFLYRPGSRETTPDGELQKVAQMIREKL